MSRKRNDKPKRITAKHVQSEDRRPLQLPQVNAKPEVDDDAWGNDGLTLKQRLFVRFYVGEAAGNAKQAARLAGYRDDNQNSLAVTASRTLILPNVQRALEKEIGKRYGSDEDILDGIAAIANANAADYLKRNPQTGKLEFDLEAMAEAGALGMIQEIQEEVMEVNGSASVIRRKVKLHSRLRGLELAAKCKGLVREQHVHSGEVAFKPITFDGDKTATG